jgi:uncharacterized protein
MSIQDWDIVSFLHWRVDPARLRPALPEGLELDTFDGTGWVSLVPFRILMRAGPVAVPGSRFPETNVRTYVMGPDGKRGLWFLSLDVSRALVVAAARLSVGLPYRWSRMRIQHRGDTVRYSARRLLPPGPRSVVEVRPGRRLASGDVGELDDFLTARFCLYSASPLGLVRVDVEHPAWVLHEGSATVVDDALVAAAGVSVGGANPMVHSSPGVRVRVGPPLPVRA